MTGVGHAEISSIVSVAYPYLVSMLIYNNPSAWLGIYRLLDRRILTTDPQKLPAQNWRWPLRSIHLHMASWRSSRPRRRVISGPPANRNHPRRLRAYTFNL